MTVLERDTQGLEGWWLCSLHGRQGIVPGNRLKILVGMYDKQQQQVQGQQQLPATMPTSQAGTVGHNLLGVPAQAYAKPPPGSQYTAMHPAYSSSSPAATTNADSVYMLPPNHGKPPLSSVYQVPTGPQGPPGPPKAPALAQKQGAPPQYPGKDIYQVPPSMGALGQQDIYQVPPSAGGPGMGQDIYQVPPSMNPSQDIYRIPPSVEKRNWDPSKPMGKVRVQLTS